MLHFDIKRLVRIQRPSHRVTGDRRDGVKGSGAEFLHLAIDDPTRAAFTAMHLRHCAEPLLLADAESTKLGKLHTAGESMHSLAVCGQSGGQETQHGQDSQRRPPTPGKWLSSLAPRNGCATAFATRRLIEVLERFRWFVFGYRHSRPS